MPFFRTVLLYCILFRLAMIESFPDCSDCGTYFSIHLRTSVPEQSPGKTVFHQLVQIKICCDKALFLSSHGCLYFPAAVPEIGIKKTGDGIFHHLLYLFLSLNVSVLLTGRKTVTLIPSFLLCFCQKLLLTVSQVTCLLH